MPAPLPVLRSHIIGQARNLQTCNTRSISSYRSDQKYFIIFVYALLKILRQKQGPRRHLFYKAKEVLQECLSCHKAGVAGYSPLIDAIYIRLRAVDGMGIHLKQTEGYVNRYLERKRISRVQSTVQL